MTKDEAREAGRVMIAYAEGEEIQNALKLSNPQSSLKWRDYIKGVSPMWDWKNYNYRVKPKPMECWVRIYDSSEDDDKFGTAWDTKERAEIGAFEPFRVVKFREVVE